MDHRSRQEFLRLANFEKKFKNFNLKSLITDHRIKCHATMSNIYLFTCYEIFSLMLRSYEILFFLPWIFHSNLVFSCYIEYKDLLVICSKRATICFVATMYLAIHNWPKVTIIEDVMKVSKINWKAQKKCDPYLFHTSLNHLHPFT